jgi:hypothetical protein
MNIGLMLKVIANLFSVEMHLFLGLCKEGCQFLSCILQLRALLLKLSISSKYLTIIVNNYCWVFVAVRGISSFPSPPDMNHAGGQASKRLTQTLVPMTTPKKKRHSSLAESSSQPSSRKRFVSADDPSCSASSSGSATSKPSVLILKNTTGFAKLHPARNSAESAVMPTPRSTSVASVQSLSSVSSKPKTHLQSANGKAQGLTEVDAVASSESSKFFVNHVFDMYTWIHILLLMLSSFDVEQDKILYSCNITFCFLAVKRTYI